MAMWNPWRGCHRHSEGCRFCYIHKGDARRGADTDKVTRTDKFYAPVEKKKSGDYKMKSGQTVYLCFSSDFLVADADLWRDECWENIICQPLLEGIDIEQYLPGVELVVAGGESDRNARPLDYEWVLDIRQQCARAGTHFEFRQCGTHFIKDGKMYTLQVKELGSQARKAGINI